MTEQMKRRLWLVRDYETVLKRHISDTEKESEEIQIAAISRKYGEITIPDRKSDIAEDWKYDDQLGMFKLSEDGQEG